MNKCFYCKKDMPKDYACYSGSPYDCEYAFCSRECCRLYRKDEKKKLIAEYLSELNERI